MDIVDRLKQYMQHVGLPSTQFADAASIPRPTLSQILNGRNKKISNELIAKLHNAFPKLNIVWLLFGDGEMENVAAAQSQPAPAYASQPQPTFTPEMANQADSASQDTESEFQMPDQGAAHQQLSIVPDANKKIQNIMVFYSDNSFEIFSPSQR